MARNVIQSEFRTFKMADGSHFVKITKKSLARNPTESDFWTSKMAASSHFVNKFHKNKNCGIDLK